MNPALLFLIRRSFVTGLVLRLKRLKNPRYLIPTLLGLAYFGLIFGPGMGLGRTRAPSAAKDAGMAAALEWGTASFGLLMAAGAWFLPARGAPIAFLESEVALLFPAPLRRRELLNFKLLDMQKYLFLPFVFIAILVFLRSGPFRGVATLLSGWLSLNVLTLHQMGARFTRQSLFEHGVPGLRRMAIPLAVLVAILAAVVFGAPRLPSPGSGMEGFLQWLDALGSSPAGWALYPFRILGRPFLATDPLSFLGRLSLLAGIAALLYLWVVRSDVAFEEAAVEHAKDLTRRIEAARKGKFTIAEEGGAKVRRSPWMLSPSGPPEVAFVWKSVTETLRGVSPRLLGLLLMGLAIGFVLAKDSGATKASPVAAIAGFVMLGLAGLLVLGGPSILGSSLRQDLECVELLKTLPISGARLVRASLAGAVAPTAVLQVILVLGAAFLLPSPKDFEITAAWRISGAAGLALLLPSLAALSACADAAGVLYFPAWVRPGQVQIQGGVEGMGHAMVVWLGKFLLLAAGMVLPGGVGAAIPIVAVGVLGKVAAPAAAMLGAVAASVILHAEIWAVSAVLGRRFVALDPADEGMLQ